MNDSLKFHFLSVMSGKFFSTISQCLYFLRLKYTMFILCLWKQVFIMNTLVLIMVFMTILWYNMTQVEYCGRSFNKMIFYLGHLGYIGQTIISGPSFLNHLNKKEILLLWVVGFWHIYRALPSQCDDISTNTVHRQCWQGHCNHQLPYFVWRKGSILRCSIVLG